MAPGFCPVELLSLPLRLRKLKLVFNAWGPRSAVAAVPSVICAAARFEHKARQGRHPTARQQQRQPPAWLASGSSAGAQRSPSGYLSIAGAQRYG